MGLDNTGRSAYKSRLVATVKPPTKRRKPQSLTARQRKLVKALVGGETTQKQAALDAGYSPSQAHKACEIIRRPRVQSFLTEALEEAGLTPRQIVQPYLDGLQAKVLVKSSSDLTAKVLNIADVGARMEAADRLTRLYGGVPRDVDKEEVGGDLNVNINIISPKASRLDKGNGSGNGQGGEVVPVPAGPGGDLKVQINIARPTKGGTAR